MLLLVVAFGLCLAPLPAQDSKRGPFSEKAQKTNQEGLKDKNEDMNGRQKNLRKPIDRTARSAVTAVACCQRFSGEIFREARFWKNH